jgi:hypothetical protein
MLILWLLMDLAAADAKHLGTWYGKPPLKIHSFDVTLRNPSKEPRWLLVPRSFPQKGAYQPDSDEAELQIFTLGESSFVIGVGANFQAVKLAGGGAVTLRGLKIESWWEKVPKSVDLEVLVARSVLVGDARLETMVGDALLQQKDVQAPRGADDPRAKKFWHPTGSIAVTVDVESRSKITVPLR